MKSDTNPTRSPNLILSLASVFLKIFLRDRQAIFFSLFFPIIFMLVFGLLNNDEADPIEMGIANLSGSTLSTQFMALLDNNPLFTVTVGEEAALREQLVAGEFGMVLVIPESFQATEGSSELAVLVDAAQVQQLGLVMPVLEQVLLSIERELRNTQPMFTLTLVDVKARSQRYLDFLIPGLLAFTLMQVAIAGSGFNIVEYRRKGILKRLFVTPVRPRDFISGIVLSRMVLCLMQLSVLLGVAVLLLDVAIVGSYVSLYGIIILGCFIFLCLGFMLGSLAKTQQAIMALGNLVIFPQIFLSGVFYPVSSLPGFMQPIASVLPLTFVTNALRDIANDGLSLLATGVDLLGILVWLLIAFIAATRLFVWKEVAA
ncbi:MAG: ABC transporter permease [Pseudomonadales bacterium]|nr:ABC transporter permease [Pseudomonadales bacterium]